MYDDIFRVNILKEAKIVGFADDVVIVVQACELKGVQLFSNLAIIYIGLWPESVQLPLVVYKTAVVLISRKRKRESPRMQGGEMKITSKQRIKLLGVMTDDTLKFKGNLE